MAYSAIRRTTPQTSRNVILTGLLAGLAGGVVLAALLIIGRLVNLQAMFINASAALYSVLTFGKDFVLGVLILLVVSTIMGGLAARFSSCPHRIRTAIIQGLLWVTLVGLLRDLIITVTTRWGPLAGLFRSLFASSGLTLIGAVIVFALITAIYYWRAGRPAGGASMFDFRASSNKTPIVRWLTVGAIVVILLLLPPILGLFFSNILNVVMMYILMGLGIEHRGRLRRVAGSWLCSVLCDWCVYHGCLDVTGNERQPIDLLAGASVCRDCLCGRWGDPWLTCVENAWRLSCNRYSRIW